MYSIMQVYTERAILYYAILVPSRPSKQ